VLVEVEQLQCVTRLDVVYILHARFQSEIYITYFRRPVTVPVLVHCPDCGIDEPSPFHHECLDSDDILIHLPCDETHEDINSTAMTKDWWTVLVEAGVKLSDITSEELLVALRACSKRAFRRRDEAVWRIWFLQ